MTFDAAAIIIGLLLGGTLICLAVWMTISAIIEEGRAMREYELETRRQRLQRELFLDADQRN